MRFVIVTGMSGSGKSTALKMLEDAGYYCVDNLPVSLIEKFVEILSMPNNEIEQVVLGLDVRAGQAFEDVAEILHELRNKGYQFEILFMDASDTALIKRYKESRRLHPMEPKGRIEDGVQRERVVLEEIRKQADYVIDTTSLLTRELKAGLDRIFVSGEEYNSLMINVMSFGFKHGIPADVDLVFDVRFLPNPYYVDELKTKTGNDKEVQDYVMACEESHIFLEKLTDMLRFLIPNYVKEGKYRLVVAIGCTGGKHRSVTLANELYNRMKNQGNYGMTIFHRDVDNRSK
ncbi:MAG: RNase adapter RapZ [Lachnospiraceae bacterium]|nr:RNase adapter RapZ [Lachnospiraceae bacterium]MBQ7777154.1 RNase adapter RapZ [Lachnospiraceae bacterium]